MTVEFKKMESNSSWRFQIYYPKENETKEIENVDNNYNVKFINNFTSKLGIIRKKPATISKEEVLNLFNKIFYSLEKIQIYENAHQLPAVLKQYQISFDSEIDPQRTRWYFSIIFSKIHSMQLEEEIENENIKYYVKTILIKELENNLIEQHAFISRMYVPISKEEATNEIKKRFPSCVFKIFDANEASACPFPNE